MGERGQGVHGRCREGRPVDHAGFVLSLFPSSVLVAFCVNGSGPCEYGALDCRLANRGMVSNPIAPVIHRSSPLRSVQGAAAQTPVNG